jgi:hypothetical protein
MYDQYGDGWNGGYFTIDNVVYTNVSSLVEIATLCVDLAGCTELAWTAGSWDSEVSWEISDDAGTVVASGAAASTWVGTGCISGCTNPSANNYDPQAVFDDGSCAFGCADNSVTVTAGGGSWDSEITWDITDGAGTL